MIELSSTSSFLIFLSRLHLLLPCLSFFFFLLFPLYSCSLPLLHYSDVPVISLAVTWDTLHEPTLIDFSSPTASRPLCSGPMPISSLFKDVLVICVAVTWYTHYTEVRFFTTFAFVLLAAHPVSNEV